MLADEKWTYEWSEKLVMVSAGVFRQRMKNIISFSSSCMTIIEEDVLRSKDVACSLTAW